MFLACKFEDSVRIAPSELGKSSLEAVEAVLEATYLDRVIPDCGLVVSIFEITKVEGGFIYHSEGAVHFNVEFTLTVFRPLLGELVIGKLKKSNRYHFAWTLSTMLLKSLRSSPGHEFELCVWTGMASGLVWAFSRTSLFQSTAFSSHQDLTLPRAHGFGSGKETRCIWTKVPNSG